jgi:CheY-like chemotaxis protein
MNASPKPLEAQSASNPGQPMPTSPASPAAGSSPKKILVVDDSLVILKVLGIKLKSAGYTVLTATDGASGISLARQERPDLVLLDISFPPDVAHGGGVRWDAFTIIAWLKRTEEVTNVPIIVITAGDPAKFKNRALAAGAVAFFQKPLDHDQLIGTIHQILGGPTPTAPQSA